MLTDLPPLAVVIPAAGVGKRMKANIAKQYLKLHNQFVLDHTLATFVTLPFVKKLIVAVSKDDPYFETSQYATHKKVIRIDGGKERANSVFNGVASLVEEDIEWVMVHDAARPCLTEQDIKNLFQTCLTENKAGILASPVRDTMKRSQVASSEIQTTVDRNNLWHALTPQCALVSQLFTALDSQRDENGDFSSAVTDEASALELCNHPVLLVEGSAKNIKITQPEDLELAEFYLQQKDKLEKKDEY